MRTIPLNFDEPKLNINRGVPLNGFCLLLHASFDSTATVQCRAHVTQYSAIIPLMVRK